MSAKHSPDVHSAMFDGTYAVQNVPITKLVGGNASTLLVHLLDQLRFRGRAATQSDTGRGFTRTHAEISDRTGLTVREIRWALSKLVVRGWVTYKRGAGGRNFYKLDVAAINRSKAEAAPKEAKGSFVTPEEMDSWHSDATANPVFTKPQEHPVVPCTVTLTEEEKASGMYKLA